MKTNIMGKYKWYLIAIIAAVLIMSIGLSFCVWDTTSVSKLMPGGTGNYKPYDLVADNFSDDIGTAGKNNIANVGDIVTFGNYYQTTEATTRDPLRWIVVNKANKELTLLAESVLAFGSFYGRQYYDKAADKIVNENGISLDEWRYQNYSVSTVNAWLNSDYTPRHDDGTAFSAGASKLAMKGFMNEAFSAAEKNYIITRTMGGATSYDKGAQDFVPDNDPANPLVKYPSTTAKVWIPSYTEVYGKATYVETAISNKGETKTIIASVLDDAGDKQLQYFVGVDQTKTLANNPINSRVIAKTTAFATTPGKSNYTIAGDTSHIWNAGSRSIGEVSRSVYMLRSPAPGMRRFIMSGYETTVASAFSSMSLRGVRPAINIPA